MLMPDRNCADTVTTVVANAMIVNNFFIVTILYLLFKIS